jgi:TonB-dependent SusC/RagA subfamily outer membrane receptor
LLQGKVAGLSISRAGGDPNAPFDIRLRGLSTIGAGTSPLVVIDGQVGADLNSVDPNDIKSIDVLKDGSSAAIYGTRGSAGVIIVTTKTGVKGTSQVTYNGSVSVENAARLTKHMTAGEYRSFIKTLGAGTDYGANTDWYKEITRPGISHQHNLSFSGGNEHTTYNASVNH